MVGVRSEDSRIHPVSVVSYHLKNISRELAERVSVVLWTESPESFILHALPCPTRSAPLGPNRARAPKVTLDAAAHRARVEVDRETFANFSAQDDTHLRLVSRLVGWDVQVVCYEQD
jgi:transcription antitermination factor NusA-like protein